MIRLTIFKVLFAWLSWSLLFFLDCINCIFRLNRSYLFSIFIIVWFLIIFILINLVLILNDNYFSIFWIPIWNSRVRLISHDILGFVFTKSRLFRWTFFFHDLLHYFKPLILIRLNMSDNMMVNYLRTVIIFFLTSITSLGNVFWYFTSFFFTWFLLIDNINDLVLYLFAKNTFYCILLFLWIITFWLTQIVCSLWSLCLISIKILSLVVLSSNDLSCDFLVTEFKF